MNSKTATNIENFSILLYYTKSRRAIHFYMRNIFSCYFDYSIEWRNKWELLEKAIQTDSIQEYNFHKHKVIWMYFEYK